MKNFYDTLEQLRSNTGYWADRILSELRYAVKLSKINDGKYDSLINNAVLFLSGKCREEGVISKQAALQAENMIMELSPVAKSFKLLCTAHAHIDMNWMWGYAETVAVTLDTFRTMLNLMEEYSDFKFSQSQASVYKIVEEFDPHMLEEIKKRIKEKRWEVTASTWVEADKNMPNGESLARHILYTKRYLSELLDLDPDSLQLDFEPDTFGHSRNVPEVLSKAGVKYYYHCRGYQCHNLYRWKSPSGGSVIAYREPLWYNAAIDSEIAMVVPEFCTANNMKTMLKVYGVGDHGGGPTRRDLEKLIEMNTWPAFPAIQFGTFAEFFAAVEEETGDKLPVVDEELNSVFTGCYTTQTRIKQSNRIGEAKLFDAETCSTLNSLFVSGEYPSKTYEEAWRKILFNQFHDIITGSCVIDTREYAMGQFQQVLAAANTGYIQAVRNIASRIDTSALPGADEDCKYTTSEGAGAGYLVTDFAIPQTDRGWGKNRIIHFFNSSSYDRSELVEITVWDWPGDVERIEISDMNGNTILHQVISDKAQQHPERAYWGHKYIKLLIVARVPACGYSTYLLKERSLTDAKVTFYDGPRIEKPDNQYILENNYIKVVLDSKDASIVSFVDKADNRELVDTNRAAGIFRLIEEDTEKGMTSWVVGRHMNIYDLNQFVKVKEASLNQDQLRQWVTYSIQFRESRLEVEISLDYNSCKLDYNVECEWLERPEKNVFIPQLNFHMPLADKCSQYKYDIPFGTIVREALNIDQPGNSWVLALPDSSEGNSLRIVTNTKYGFRGFDNSLSLTLIRSSYDPDPYPENGIQKFQFAVELIDPHDNKALINKAFDYSHPIGYVPGTKHEGELPLEQGFLSIKEGSVAVSTVKVPEDKNNKQMIIRVYEVMGTDTTAVFKLASPVAKAWYVDINEKELSGNDIVIEGNLVKADVKAHSIACICVEL
ncbi:MAG: glycoside hydrolase family 38 C-terminal domain-containing protein [Clostridia bacterium]|nr:glycoside hydrolase family 38 C-terminal domain-containing protein [Clostridia bacterium]MDD4679404.1 glycoside hydrolase family 38 C-terminal domain-containing protein [Clostridia bacterium]